MTPATNDTLDLSVGGSATSSPEHKQLLERLAVLEGQVRSLTTAVDAKVALMRKDMASAMQVLEMKSARALRNHRPPNSHE